MKPKYEKLANISGGIFSLNILFGSSIAICPINQQKRRGPDAATYSRKITNNTFYRLAKIMPCIWRVPSRSGWHSSRQRLSLDISNSTKYVYVRTSENVHTRMKKPWKSCFANVMKIRVCECRVKCVTLP